MDNIYTHIKQYAKIGIALSSEKNINKLFEMIVEEAISLSSADAGTLYILDDKSDNLHFEILQNISMNTRLGGTKNSDITFPPVPLYVDDKPNYANVSSYVALTGKSVNIPDVYNANTFDFTGPKKYDEATGYLSKSMLVIPMKNHEDNIIGVLQLLNAQRPGTDIIIPFSNEYEDLIASLASLAAVALNNVQLIQKLELLFHAFIRSIATAIDEKSPYTGGHIKRVVDITTMIAEQVNKTDKGHFKDTSLTEVELEEIKIAAWMHDVGKITTPEYIVDKKSKLETVFDRIELVKTRFQLIKESINNQYLNMKLELFEKGSASKLKLDTLRFENDQKLQLLDEELDFLISCNNTGEFMSDEMLEKLQSVASKSFYINDQKKPYLNQNEVLNLCIRKGTLTDVERKKIENHAAMTLKITKELPFPEHLTNVPGYASAHHEKLDGTGYPLGLSAKELPLQSRIICIADIFEALTAHDRPYKKAMKLSQALKILGFMEKDNHIDGDILELFISSGLVDNYAKAELSSEQLDN